jgi:hypothetical protein
VLLFVPLHFLYAIQAPGMVSTAAITPMATAAFPSAVRPLLPPPPPELLAEEVGGGLLFRVGVGLSIGNGDGLVFGVCIGGGKVGLLLEVCAELSVEDREVAGDVEVEKEEDSVVMTELSIYTC